LANIDTNDDKTTAPVMSYPKDQTSQGVYDMLGNVREICLDAFAPYKSNPLAERDPCENPVDSVSASYVVRGAGFGSLPDECALTRRDKQVSETDLAEDIGFRLVIVCPKPKMPR
jgi:formylglycine-generating enzyme required for sulfatase activity